MVKTSKFEEISMKLHAGLDLSYRRMVEEKVRKGEPVIVGTPEGKVVSIDATEVLSKLNNSSDNSSKK